jgi:glutamate-5-semialdehyde dehydrogenase
MQREKERILEANRQDIALAEKQGLSAPLLERLSLEKRLDGMLHDLTQIVHLPDPVGEEYDIKKLPNSLHIAKCRVPIGVLGVIYESRPNVTIDIAALSIKSGNCALLRGGSEIGHTNRVWSDLIASSLVHAGLPQHAIQCVASSDRALVKELLGLNDYIDLIIPRGGAALQQFCLEHTKIPVITGGIGICHLFVDATADSERSIQVILNAKTQRPTVCNALDTVLVHTAIAATFIPRMVHALAQAGVSFRLDSIAARYVDNPCCTLATLSDWDTEWLSLILGVKVVSSLEEAITHIHTHSSKHSDGILTQDTQHAELFVKAVDSAAVYVNASTRFTDGGQFGLGAEVAISTQKLHARGPMGLQELTTYKWVVRGDYHFRN